MKLPCLHFLICLIFALLSGACSLINSGNVNIKYTTSNVKFQGIKYENKNNIKDVSISLKNVQHPQRWGKWNFNMRILPSIHYDSTDFTTAQTYADAEGNQVSYPEIQYKRLMTFANLGFNFHTPIGGFILSGGYGIAAYHKTDNAGLDTYRTRDIRKADLAYIGFLSKRIFVYVGPRYLKESYEEFIFAFRLGWYWGKV